MAGNDALHQGSAGARLPDHEDGRRVGMPGRLPVEPVRGIDMSQRVEHLDFGRLVELHRLPAGCRSPGERFERLVPLLEVLEFLAERVIQECRGPRTDARLRREFVKLIGMIAIHCFSNAGQEPVRVRIAGLQRQYVVQLLFSLPQVAEVHLRVRVVDQECNLARLLADGFSVPVQRLLLLAEHGMHGPDKIVHHGIAVFMTDGVFQGEVGAVRLPGRHEEFRHVRPCRAVVRLELRDGAECADRGPGLFQLERDETHQEMRLDEIRLRLEKPPTAFGCVVEPVCREQGESLLQHVVHPARRLPGRHHRLPAAHPGSDGGGREKIRGVSVHTARRRIIAFRTQLSRPPPSSARARPGWRRDPVPQGRRDRYRSQ